MILFSSSSFTLKSARRAFAAHLAPAAACSTILVATMCQATDQVLPSTMQGPPISSLAPPGKCQFNPERTSVPLMERFPLSSTSTVFRFGLPNKDEPLNLSTCACILAHAIIDGEDVTRPYTPISTNQQIGSFDVLVKHYGPTAKMSRHLHDELQVGDTMEFTHIDFNVKLQAPFYRYDFIGMLVGGTGITPMIQALHAILGYPKCQTKVCLLYGSRVQDDILGKELLHQWAKEYPDRFECIDVLSHEPDNSNWKGHRGWINRELIASHFPSPQSDRPFKLFVCGPPPMYDALSGPRNEPDKVSGLLGEMGYLPDQVYKF